VLPSSRFRFVRFAAYEKVEHRDPSHGKAAMFAALKRATALGR
jgi:hypothetical protein